MYSQDGKQEESSQTLTSSEVIGKMNEVHSTLQRMLESLSKCKTLESFLQTRQGASDVYKTLMNTQGVGAAIESDEKVNARLLTLNASYNGIVNYQPVTFKNAQGQNYFFNFTEEDARRLMVSFCINYTALRNAQWFTFMRSNFIITLRGSYQTQLGRVVDHALENPTNRTAHAFRDTAIPSIPQVAMLIQTIFPPHLA